MSKARSFAIGDKVRLTAKFLRSTGQYTGRQPFSVWTITGFSANGWAVTDEPANNPPGYYTDAELATEPYLAFRRIATGNLEHVRR